MTVRQGTLSGLFIIEHDTHNDERGFFRETMRVDELEAALGEQPHFVQVDHSHSKKGVLRGLHAENWDKLIYVPHGEVFQAVADIRPESPTFRQVETFQMGETNRCMLFIPRRMGNGFYVLSDEADYVYQVSAYYDGTDQLAVAWDDPDLAVPWPISNPILSPKDQSNPTLRQLFPEHFHAS